MELDGAESSSSSLGENGSLSGEALNDNAVLNVVIKVRLTSKTVEKRMCFQLNQKIWEAKLQILNSFGQELKDGLNYGFFIMPCNNRAGKFLDDERYFKDYNLDGKTLLEFKFKRRIYRQLNLDFAIVRKYNVKANLKLLLEYVRNRDAAKVEKLLYEKFVDANFIAESANGDTPLTLAASMNKTEEVLKALVNNGCHVDFRNKHGLTAVHRAVMNGNAAVTELLLDLGSSANYRDTKGLTPLYHCVQSGGNHECTEILLKDMAELDIGDDKGWREMHQACRYGYRKHLELLLSYGANMNAQNEAGNTPLHICALYNQEAAARILLFRGVNKFMKNQAAQTAFQVAIVAGNIDVAEVIRRYTEEDVVPILEAPVYHPRRRQLGNIGLIRTSSEPFLSHNFDVISVNSRHSASSVPVGRDLIQRKDSNSLGRISPMIHRKIQDVPSNLKFIATKHYTAQEEGELTFKKGDVISVLCIGEYNYWEGCIGERKGWFPSYYVEELPPSSEEELKEAMSKKKEQDGGGKRKERKTIAGLGFNSNISPASSIASLTPEQSEPRIVLVQRGKKGFGFILRGAKTPKSSSAEFIPTKDFPALQYLEHVDKGSPADKAKLKKGDFVLEINGEDVTSAPHQYVVHMVVNAPDTIVMKVVTVPGAKSYETLQRIALTNPHKQSMSSREAISLKSESLSGITDEEDSPRANPAAVARPDVEIISIDVSGSGTRTPTTNGHSGANSPSAAAISSQAANQRMSTQQLANIHQWQSYGGNNSTVDDMEKPTVAKAPLFQTNTIARIDSRKKSVQASSSLDEEYLQRTGVGENSRRYSAGTDSAHSSQRSSPASTNSYKTNSSASGADSAVGLHVDRTFSDPGKTNDNATLSKRPVPPPPMRSYSLSPTDANGRPSKPPPPPPPPQSPHPEEQPQNVFSSAIARAALKMEKQKSSSFENLNKRLSNPEIAPQGLTPQGFSAFEIAMAAKERTMKRDSVEVALAPKKAAPSQQSALQKAIAKRKESMESNANQNHGDIENRIMQNKAASKSSTPEEDELKSVLKKRRTVVDVDEQSSPEDESGDSLQNSPVRQVPKLAPKPVAAVAKPTKPPQKEEIKKPHLVTIAPKPISTDPIKKPKVLPKPQSPITATGSGFPYNKNQDSSLMSEESTSADSVDSINCDNSSISIVPPPAGFYVDHQSDKVASRAFSNREHSADTASVTSSMSSLSTLSSYSTMMTDPSSTEGSDLPNDKENILESVSSTRSTSSTSSSVVTVKSTSDLDNDNERGVDVGGKQMTQESINEHNKRNEEASTGQSTKPVLEWTVDEVADWLSTIKMADYKETFVENEIAGEHLIALSKDDLGELGITKMGHKLSIMKAIKQLSS